MTQRTISAGAAISVELEPGQSCRIVNTEGGQVVAPRNSGSDHANSLKKRVYPDYFGLISGFVRLFLLLNWSR